MVRVTERLTVELLTWDPRKVAAAVLLSVALWHGEMVAVLTLLVAMGEGEGVRVAEVQPERESMLEVLRDRVGVMVRVTETLTVEELACEADTVAAGETLSVALWHGEMVPVPWTLVATGDLDPVEESEALAEGDRSPEALCVAAPVVATGVWVSEAVLQGLPERLAAALTLAAALALAAALVGRGEGEAETVCDAEAWAEAEALAKVVGEMLAVAPLLSERDTVREMVPVAQGVGDWAGVPVPLAEGEGEADAQLEREGVDEGVPETDAVELLLPAALAVAVAEPVTLALPEKVWRGLEE